MTDTSQLSWIIAIDPSINSLGYAVFDIREARLIKFGQIESSEEEKKLSLERRIQKQLCELQGVLPGGEIKCLWVIEEPELFGGVVSTAAVHNSSLKKLIMIVGALVWHAWQTQGFVQLIPVSTWKGQLPKHVTRERSEARHEIKFKKHHSDAADAVSLGDWYLDWMTKKGLR